jgi:serine/threonine protein kinase
LLENLFAIHDIGVVHRDIRPANILMKLDQFVIADFGFAVESGSEEIYSGTRETASQRILSLLYKVDLGEAHSGRGRKNQKIRALQEDDLESFLKLLKITFAHQKLPPVDPNTTKYYQDLYCFWIVDHDIRHFLGLPNIESKREFLRSFCMRNVNLDEAEKFHAEISSENNALSLNL